MTISAGAFAYYDLSTAIVAEAQHIVMSLLSTHGHLAIELLAAVAQLLFSTQRKPDLDIRSQKPQEPLLLRSALLERSRKA